MFLDRTTEKIDWAESCDTNAEQAFRIFGKVPVERTTGVLVSVAIVDGIWERLAKDKAEGREQ